MIRAYFPFVAALTLCAAASALALSDVELRERWSQSVVNVKTGVCKDEQRRTVIKKLDYAAILIMHNEIGEAKQVLEMAAGAAKSKACKDAIVNHLEPNPGGADPDRSSADPGFRHPG